MITEYIGFSAAGYWKAPVPLPFLSHFTKLHHGNAWPDPQASASRFPGPLIYCVVAGIAAVVLGIFFGGWRIRRRQRREHGLLWLPPGFAPQPGKKRRCRREPVGEDAIGLKPMKSGTEFVEDPDMCPSPHFDGPFSLKDTKEDPDSISDQNQGLSRTKKQAQLNKLSSAEEKKTKVKEVKTQESVCGLTPLMPLAHIPVSEMEESGADRQEEDFGETPLHLAARYSRADAARKLLASGANANARDEWGRTPLHSAIAADALGVFQILLRHRQTDLDASAHDGSTPLILATRLGVENVVEELVANHVDIGATDKRALCPVQSYSKLQPIDFHSASAEGKASHWVAVSQQRQPSRPVSNGAIRDAQDQRKAVYGRPPHKLDLALEKDEGRSQGSDRHLIFEKLPAAPSTLPPAPTLGWRLVCLAQDGVERTRLPPKTPVLGQAGRRLPHACLGLRLPSVEGSPTHCSCRRVLLSSCSKYPIEAPFSAPVLELLVKVELVWVGCNPLPS
uniref:Uncharacterized protein n=1 Tax=Sphaerodactylus townsendi TaxID=933632 RepID=A0ACB8EFV1_9SAUR